MAPETRKPPHFAVARAPADVLRTAEMTLTAAPAPDVLGREEELAAVGRFLAGGPGPAAALVLEGEAGIGKTTLWLHAVEQAAARSYTVISSRPAESDEQLSFAGLADLLGGVSTACSRGCRRRSARRSRSPCCSPTSPSARRNAGRSPSRSCPRCGCSRGRTPWRSRSTTSSGWTRHRRTWSGSRRSGSGTSRSACWWRDGATGAGGRRWSWNGRSPGTWPGSASARSAWARCTSCSAAASARRSPGRRCGSCTRPPAATRSTRSRSGAPCGSTAGSSSTAAPCRSPATSRRSSPTGCARCPSRCGRPWSQP